MSFSQAQITAGQVRFVHDATNSAPSYDVSVSDGTLTAGPSAASISFSLYSTSAGPMPAPVMAPPSAAQHAWFAERPSRLRRIRPTAAG